MTPTAREVVQQGRVATVANLPHMTRPLDLTTDVEVMTVPQAAALTGRTPQAIRYWIKTGRVRAAQAGDRWFVAKEDITQNLTVPEAAALIGISPQGVAHHIQSGRLPATKHGRLWLLDRAAVEDFAATRTRGVYLPHKR